MTVLLDDGLMRYLAIVEVLIQPPRFHVIPAVEVLYIRLDIKQGCAVEHVDLGEVYPVPLNPL